MFLKSLVVQGFKSFADKTVLSFGPDITAIVGPNGSGKSNISDAIRWVMGEQSTKALRGAKMEDVIFGGTQKRPQQSYAEASLILDNADGAFRMDAPEIMVTRRYYRSGESEFYLNKQSARLRDINELFMDTGLGKEGYANISQGRIDEILSLKSTDRREIFEEAAGISKFRHRKEETERKLAATEDNLLRIGDKISELELQVEPLREQAEKAKKYLVLRDELKGVEVAVWLDSLDRFSAAKKKAEEDYRSAAFVLEQEHAALEALYQKSEALSQSVRDFDTAMEEKRTEIAESDGIAQQLEGEENVLQASMENNNANMDRVRAELSEQENRAGGLQAQISDSEARIAALMQRMGSLDETLKQLEEEAAALSRSSEGITREYLSLQNRLGDLRSQLAQRTAEAASSETAAKESEARLSQVADELREAKEKHSSLLSERAESEKALADAKEAVTAAQNSLAGYALRQKSREQRRDTLQAEVNHLNIGCDTLQSRIHLLQEMEREYEGFSRAVKAVMQEKSGLRGICGPVSKLISVEERCAVAIETALGAAMQQIIVETEQDGKAAIQFLKRRDIGRATFLPISVMRGKTLQERGLETTRGFVGIASELIHCEARYREILLYLLGRTVVTEDLDDAIAMARQYGNRFRIVTLDGQVLNAGGSMTGGAVSKNAGILSRANELQKLESGLQERKAQLEEKKKALQEAQRSAEEVQYEISVVSAQLREAEDQALRQEGSLRHFEVLMETVADVIRSDEREEAAARQRLDAEQKNAAARQAQAELLTAQIAETEQSAAALELGRSDSEEQAKHLSDQIQAARLERAGAGAERDSVQAGAAQLRLLQSQMQGDRGQKEALLRQYEADNEKLTDRIASLQAQEAQQRSRSEALRGDLSVLQRDRMSAEAEKTVSERSAQEKNKDILNQERESARLEQKKLSAELEEKQIIDKLWDTYGLTHSTAVSQRAELESAAQGQRRIGELKRKISALGTPNLGAIEEFARVNERYEYLTTQRDDVLTSKKDLEEIVHSITKEMTNIFVTEFGRINEYFGQTFTEMFGGGKGSLELEDPSQPLDCGIEIRVQPPGKQLKTITLLSGGEKAFVAIALYFAILKVRPTPFCMLDEIDAALDDRNVDRFASYLRSLSKMTQFIVVTHRRGTMEEADTLYGVTMQEQGVSKILHLNMNQMIEQLGITE